MTDEKKGSVRSEMGSASFSVAAAESDSKEGGALHKLKVRSSRAPTHPTFSQPIKVELQ